MYIPVIKWILGIIAALFLGAAAYLAFQNRSSPQVLPGFFILVILGSVASLYTTVYSIKSEDVSINFEKHYVFNKVYKNHPWEWRKKYLTKYFGGNMVVKTNFLVDWAIENNPDLVKVDVQKPNEGLVDKGKILYEKILFWQISNILFTSCHWNANVNRYHGPGGESFSYGPPMSKEGLKGIEWDVLKSIAPKNELLNWDGLDNQKKIFYVPKDVSIEGDEKQIVLKDSFVNIKIEFNSSSGTIGAGIIGSLLGFDSVEDIKHWSQNYRINIKANFNPYKSYHPKMESYREWVENIISELTYFLDSEKLWENLKADFVFYETLEGKDQPFTHEEARKAYKEYDKWLQSIVDKQEQSNIDH